MCFDKQSQEIEFNGWVSGKINNNKISQFNQKPYQDILHRNSFPEIYKKRSPPNQFPIIKNVKKRRKKRSSIFSLEL